jgi:hypothetical protein
MVDELNLESMFRLFKQRKDEISIKKLRNHKQTKKC